MDDGIFSCDIVDSLLFLPAQLFFSAKLQLFFYLIAVLDVFSDLAHEIVIGGAILVVILYEVLLFYKLIVNFRVRKYGYMFIFLYFCSVELLPTLVFGHLAVWITDSFIVKNYLY